MQKCKLHSLAQDIAGEKFGMLTAIHYCGPGRGGALWLVKCDCGVEKVVKRQSLFNGRTKSCGCNQYKTGHGMSGHPAYRIWIAIRERCYSVNRLDYKNYGGRGVTVCEKWEESFEAFWEDMQDTYCSELSIERVDNDLGYSLENCCWATKKTQARNRRDNRIVDTPKGRMLLCEAEEFSGINRVTLSDRIKRGWPTKRLFDKLNKAENIKV